MAASGLLDKLLTFSGAKTDDLSSFLETFEEVTKAMGFSDEQ